MGEWNWVKYKKDTNFCGWVCPTCSKGITPDMYEVVRTVVSNRLNKEVVVEAPSACIGCGAFLAAPLSEEGLVRLKKLVAVAKDIYGEQIPDIIKQWEFRYFKWE